MFDHSIKVPRLYKTASKIAKEVSEGKGSIKQLVYESKHPNIKALYALVVHTFQRTDDIERLLRKSKLLSKEPRFNPWLAKILITELLWGKKHLSSQAKPVKTILAYEQILKAHLSDASDDFHQFQVDKPRYARINTLKITINEAIEGFRAEGWILKRYTDSSNYLGFLDAVASLGPEEFMIDFHLPYLLIFPPKTQFYQHQAYKNGSIILQDKASCLPVHMLNPNPGSTILDMCAAPGMKTTQCAASIEDNGTIYAVEIGKKRFQILNKIIESSGATCIETINTDVLTLSGKMYPNVEYIIVDPSCSGSGITDRVEIGQQEIEQHKDRLDKLAGFQIKTLRHAVTRFPKARKVVYSTCSVYPEENEDVVRQVLETCTTFKLVPAVQFLNNKWENFGSSDFGNIGNYCLYAKPDIDLTSGFFVAVLERLEEGETNPFLNTKLYSRKFSSRVKREQKGESQEEQEAMHDFESPKMKKIKIENVTENLLEETKYEENKSFDNGSNISTRENPDSYNETKKKKKKKKEKMVKDENGAENIVLDTSQDLDQLRDQQEFKEEKHQNMTVPKKKKKQKVQHENLLDIEDEVSNEIKVANEDRKSKKRKKEKRGIKSEATNQFLEEDGVSKEHQPECPDKIESTNEVKDRKNKKRKKEKHETKFETSHEVLEQEDALKEHKKKKKKSENTDMNESSTHFEEIGKSKEHKDVEHKNSAEILSCDNSETHEKRKSKKKKTKA